MSEKDDIEILLHKIDEGYDDLAVFTKQNWQGPIGTFLAERLQIQSEDFIKIEKALQDIFNGEADG